eukprot:jgi/Psemu1/318447/estExt_fgenesh1_pm.C_750001
MKKNRTAIRIKQKVQGKKSHNKSEDLARLTEQYNVFTKRLQGLVAALVNQHAAMEQMSKAKFQVAQHLAVLSKDTVLFESTGQTAGADRPADSVNSYFSVHEGVANKTKMYADKYKQFIVDYAQEWYKTITERVGADLKKAEKIRVELDHYQSKVESLRQTANATMAKGKQVDGKAAEKLTRNEDKLIKIKETSSKFINDLCMLMEEITERSWRDLHPLLIKCSQFETQVTGDDAKAMTSLNQVVAKLKKIGSDHGIKPDARLKDLATVDPHILSTRSKDDNRNLAIENGFAGMALGGSVSVTGSIASGMVEDNNSQYFPPGSTSAQGLGGFPVRVQSGDMGQSTTGTPSTMSMMNINAAPAPTMDTMAQAFGPTASAPNSGSMFGSTTNSAMNRRLSMDSFRSDFSGAPAPPPSAAPPPPPPSDSFGGGYNAFGAASPPPSSNAFGAAPHYGSPSPMAPPATPQMMGGMYSGGYPPQSTPQGAAGNFSHHQQPPTPQSAGGGFAQSPMAGGMNFAQQPSMYSNHQHQSPSYGNPTSPFG